MIKITSSIARRWSIVGSRAAFGLALVELAKEDNNIMALTADVSTSAGLERMKKNFPEQYLDVGIAEQNMMGIAAGLASEGYSVVTATFAPFQSMRCLEQVRVNLGYMGQKVIMVGLASGVVLGNLGYTHCCFEDMSILRSIPNISVVAPADCVEVGKALEAALNYKNSVYIRLGGGANCPIVYKDDYKFEIGKAINLRDGQDVAIIAAGTMVSESLRAAEILQNENISAAVINMHTIKPLDEETIKRVCKNFKLIVTVEEHSIIGGLGSAVAEYKATLDNTPKQLILGLPDSYGHGGMYKDLLEQYGLTGEQIANKIKKFI